MRRQADARGVPADIMMPRVLLVVASFLLVLVGLVMVFSASTVETISQGDSIFSYVGKQALFAVVGAIGAFVIAKFIPYHVWKGGWAFRLSWGVCALLLLAVPFVGTEILGAKRWILIGGFSLQPTEFAKIAIVLAAAKVLYDFRNEFTDAKRALVSSVVLVVLPVAFLYKTQSDMGSAAIILVGVITAMWLGEFPMKRLIPLVVVVGVVGVIGLAGYRSDRISVWLNPWDDGEGGYGTGYQMIRSFYAFAEGGIFGVGLGNSREKFLYLPEAETDFIFSIIGEELGLIGALFVIALFMVVLFAGLRIAHHAPDNFGCMMAGSLTVMLVAQAFLNMACATGLLPTTGKPLPFISSGGSSILASLFMVGLIMSVSVGSNTLTSHERRRNDLNVIRVDDQRPRMRSMREDDKKGSRGAGLRSHTKRVRAAAPMRPSRNGRLADSARISPSSRSERRSRDVMRGREEKTRERTPRNGAQGREGVSERSRR